MASDGLRLQPSSDCPPSSTRSSTSESEIEMIAPLIHSEDFSFTARNSRSQRGLLLTLASLIASLMASLMASDCIPHQVRLPLPLVGLHHRRRGGQTARREGSRQGLPHSRPDEAGDRTDRAGSSVDQRQRAGRRDRHWQPAKVPSRSQAQGGAHRALARPPCPACKCSPRRPSRAAQTLPPRMQVLTTARLPHPHRRRRRSWR